MSSARHFDKWKMTESVRNVNDACTIAVGEKLWCGVAMGINHMAEGLKDIMDDYIVQNAKKKNFKVNTDCVVNCVFPI